MCKQYSPRQTTPKSSSIVPVRLLQKGAVQSMSDYSKKKQYSPCQATPKRSSLVPARLLQKVAV